jgi:glycosyltransferase involved in cell wall biosynthesis
MQKKILFITTSNLATNPRLTKELKLAVQNDFKTTVLQFILPGWSEIVSDDLKRQFSNTEFIELSASRKPYLDWLLSSWLEYLLRKAPCKLMNVRLLAYSLSKRSYLILNKLSKVCDNYDWVIAHNPGAFYPSFIFAKQKKCKLGLDIEDYHPGEYNDSDLTKRMLKMMEYVLPKADYCSFAAPLIQLEVEKHIPNHSSNWFTVINGFPQSEFTEPKRIKYAKLKVVWFSQNINPGRGLEKFISVMREFEDDIELHLVGELCSDNRKLLFNDSHNIIIHAPMKQMELHQFLSTFTVGLVTDPPINRNRELAITNKIIAYSQAGLYILSVSADGHNQFLKEGEFNYRIVENDKKEIRQALLDLISNYSTIVDYQYKNYEYAKINAWESINSKLTETWQN